MHELREQYNEMLFVFMNIYKNNTPHWVNILFPIKSENVQISNEEINVTI